MEDGSLKQSSNMRTGALETHEGTWKILDNNLTFELQLDDHKVKLVYTYTLKENNLILERSNPTGSWRTISKFRKK